MSSPESAPDFKVSNTALSRLLDLTDKAKREAQLQEILTPDRIRAADIAASLNRMVAAVRRGIFPRTYVYLPVLKQASGLPHDSHLYEALLEINRWYFAFYRKTDPSVARRKKLVRYLVCTQGISEADAERVVCRAARDSDTYSELVRRACPEPAEKSPAQEAASRDDSFWEPVERVRRREPTLLHAAAPAGGG